MNAAPNPPILGMFARQGLDTTLEIVSSGQCADIQPLQLRERH